MDRIYIARQQRFNATPPVRFDDSHPILAIEQEQERNESPIKYSDTTPSYHSTSSEDTLNTADQARRAGPAHQIPLRNAPPPSYPDPERRPLLLPLSPQVSPLVTTVFSPGYDSRPAEPFPDLEADYTPSEGSYEGLDVIGGRRPRRRWDLGRQYGSDWEGSEGSGCDAWLAILFWGMFVVVVLGGSLWLLLMVVKQGGY